MNAIFYNIYRAPDLVSGKKKEVEFFKSIFKFLKNEIKTIIDVCTYLNYKVIE